MNSVEILRETRSLIAHPSHWTKEQWAKDDDGRSVKGTDPGASCWCLGGAMWAVTKDPGFEETEAPYLYDEALEAWAILRHEAGEDPIEFNDDHSHREVLDLLDRAIREAEQR